MNRVVPKRLHRVTAALQHDVGEARRQRLKPAGRKGVPDQADWHGVKVRGCWWGGRMRRTCNVCHLSGM